jgi:L-threonylcarbamoyladenylate synthase
MEILHVDPESPDAAIIARAAAVLRGGGLVAFPTETVYGLGASALDAAACERIFIAKGRPAHNPIIVHGASTAEARQVVSDWPDAAARLASRFWPGPLTLVLPKIANVPDVVTAGGPTVAVRVPAHPVAMALLRAAGIPIAAPSANRSGQLSPTRAEHVLHGLSDQIDILIDGGRTPGGVESTVLDLSRSLPRLLRPGLVSPAEIESMIGGIERTASSTTAGEALPSPGMLARHYAPRARLECVTGSGATRVAEMCREGFKVGWLLFDQDAPTQPSGTMPILMPKQPKAYAAMLYEALHRLDGLDMDRIVVELPPDTEDWLAIHDRLRRAATPE